MREESLSLNYLSNTDQMGSYSRFLEDLNGNDGIIEIVLKREYYSTTKYLMIYPEITKKTFPLIIAQYTLALMLFVFHCYILVDSSYLLIPYSFTLSVFRFQVFMLISFCALALMALNRNRENFRLLHSEMVYKVFEYESKNEEILDGFFKEMRREKIKFIALPIVTALCGINVIIVSPIIDNVYGDLGFNMTDIGMEWDVPIPNKYPFPLSNPFLVSVGTLLQALTAAIVLSVIGLLGYVFINIAEYLLLNMKYLSYNIQNIEFRALKLFNKRYSNITPDIPDIKYYSDKRYMKCYDYCLNKCVRHHQLILR